MSYTINCEICNRKIDLDKEGCVVLCFELHPYLEDSHHYTICLDCYKSIHDSILKRQKGNEYGKGSNS